MVLEDIQNHFLLFVADGYGGTVVSDFIADMFLDIFKRNVYYQMYKKHCSPDQEVMDDQEVIADQTSNDDRTQNLLENALLGSIHELEDLSPDKLSREVVEAAYKKGSTDNISCCIAFLFI